MIGMVLLGSITPVIENRSKYIQNKMTGMRKSLYWNAFLRFLIEGCLEIFLGTGIQLLQSIEKNE